MKIISIVGTRPNFIKIAPVVRAIGKYNASLPTNCIQSMLVHTGQHYDYDMSDIFFEHLQLPQPDINLDIGSGNHGEQTGNIMIGLEKVFYAEKPDVVVVVGDVNSTLAATLVAVKMQIPVAHIEAGLRSNDRSMPEEINRLLTDAIADYLFTPSRDANENLKREGITEEKIYFVGNIMVDSLLHDKTRAKQSKILLKLGLQKQCYALLTLHRPANVDEKDNLFKLIQASTEISRRIPIVFPIHPRTKKSISEFGFTHFFRDERLLLTEPLGYLDFLNLEMNAKFVMTDSGGIQEETTAFSVPCLTLRNSTERPITVTEGSNTLVSDYNFKIVEEASRIMDGKGKIGHRPRLWDGKTAERIINILAKRNTEKDFIS